MISPTWDISYTTDDASDTTPTWTTVANANVRSVSVSRGRDNELGRVDAGTATLVLNNRTNLFNPQITTGLRPMNRWRLRATFNAVTYDIFLGYAESYEQSWPGTGKDAITTVRLVDEFKVLALDRLPAMDPPKDTYEALVMFDEPHGYWRFQETSVTNGFIPTAGSTRLGWNALGLTTSPIVGDWDAGTAAGRGAVSTTTRLHTIDSDNLPGLEVNGPGDAGGLSAMTFETWFKTTEATPGATRLVATGPQSGGLEQWLLQHTTGQKMRFVARNSGGTVYTADSVSTISANTWYHVVGTVDVTGTKIWLNGAIETAVSWTGAFGAMDAGQFMYLGDIAGPGGTRTYDEVAFYRTNLVGARILAHYTAGKNRGFPAQDPGARVTAVLASSTSIAASSVRAGSREMTPTFMRGQSPLDELRNAEAADSVDAVLYISANGTITFLDDGHRSSSPWNTTQATFDDDGTDLPYRECTVDYSEAFLYNKVDGTRIGGTTISTSDATSISRYRTRPLTITDWPITTDADVTSGTTALLAKYKDPFNRITSITIDLKTSAVISACLSLELAERVRIFRTPVGGGTRIDQTSFVQSIQLDATPERPWQLRLGVSPL